MSQAKGLDQRKSHQFFTFDDMIRRRAGMHY